MAKAREIPGLHADIPFADAAAATVAIRAEELFEQSANVLDTSDIERVHDMRVASRRLRAVLEIYAPCFPKHEFKPILREVKALADALGERRDPDVLLEHLQKIEGSLPKSDWPGVEAFAGPIHEQQARGNEILAAALEEAERSDLRGRLAALASSAVEPEPPEDDVEGGEAGDAAAAQTDDARPAAEADGAEPAAQVDGAESAVQVDDGAAIAVADGAQPAAEPEVPIAADGAAPVAVEAGA